MKNLSLHCRWMIFCLFVRLGGRNVKSGLAIWLLAAMQLVLPKLAGVWITRHKAKHEAPDPTRDRGPAAPSAPAPVSP